ncbi:UPF0755 protein [Dysgonomonas sp. PH5-45]|uniref:endolytic transglycosylase MltG n=1 Tax=unclassified Dysgonomonas TaxID=2630389 RepID=UPI00247613E5|nr:MULTISPECIES: endolytic transglycosylase MltG [unclassified Dysgonomonas]MDH6355662.1 UPF0755 protein [Dysgonomonas sp. PH5-45]MDH6388555.1 UPF0755 protein [Dysgonomonas sp. PH5-37]
MNLKKHKTLAITLLVFILILTISGIFAGKIFFTTFNIDKTVYIYIDKNKNYSDVLIQLDTTAHISDRKSFDYVADILKLKSSLKSGRYAVEPNMKVWELVRNIRNGNQSAIRFTFNNIRTKEELAERISEQLDLSETDILTAFNDSAVCSKLGFTPQTIAGMFIPDTYEVYWNLSLNKFLDRMATEYSRFWEGKRMDKANSLGLTSIQVSALASIVEEECTYRDEYPMVARLYLNRLERGQLLQADPTVKFAVGDFSLRRILLKHLEIDSPYNTYRNAGLPPGPIRIPSVAALDAVLNPAQHDFLFMCAKEDFSGRHNFATTYAQHNRNATLYQKALNARNIR